MLDEIVDYFLTNKMKVTQEKSKVMLFNSSRKYDFVRQPTQESGSNLAVVESYPLLGVIIQSNLKGDKNTDYICRKAFDRLWMQSPQNIRISGSRILRKDLESEEGLGKI